MRPPRQFLDGLRRAWLDGSRQFGALRARGAARWREARSTFFRSRFWYRFLALLGVLRGRAGQLASVSGGVVVGVAVNALSDPESRGAGDAVRRALDPTVRPIAWIWWLALAALVLAPVAGRQIGRMIEPATHAVLLSERLRSEVVEPRLQSLSRGHIAWGSHIALQTCPHIDEGWRTSEIKVVKDPTDFRMEPGERARYETWIRSLDDESILRGTKLRLVENPSSFVDDPGLHLRVQVVPFPETLYANRVLAADPSRCEEILDSALRGQLVHPHTLVLCVVVATEDGWLLLTQRSHKVAYERGKWSCSIEEQLSIADLHDPQGDVVLNWCRRALREELGLAGEELRDLDIRITAVYIEGDVLNVCLAGLITLPVKKAHLDAIISARPRQDYEFQDWDFMRWSEVVPELVNPTRPYHTSSPFRMYLAGMLKYGVFDLSQRLVDEFRGKS